jgi:VIT1/CCC1 family predicted Fe2+/Mn2+ transporter
MDDLHRWREEKQSAWLYARVAAAEPDARRAEMFRSLARAAESQAELAIAAQRRSGAPVPAFVPGMRARIAARLVARLGPRRVRSMLAAMKVRGLSVYLAGKPREGHPMPSSIDAPGERHGRGAAGGSLRAAVFGVNDGLVSNTSLILGVAGATEDARLIALSGVAGLLAGAFSMAAGEFVSVQSQRELYERQIAEEEDEIARYPEEEAEELALIYAARGVPLEQARSVTRAMLADPREALAVLAREELGLDPDGLGSPARAALASFAAFALGAALPLVPFLVPGLAHRLLLAGVISGLALFWVGAVLSLFTGKSAIESGLRLLVLGAAAATVTFAIGRLLGVNLS